MDTGEQFSVTHLMKNPEGVKMSSFNDWRPIIEKVVTNTGLDAYLRVVSDRSRRSLIDQLRNNGKGQMTIDELVDQLDGAGDDATSTDRPPEHEELALQLYHNHLPKLDDFGVVDYDHECGTVQYLPNEQLEAVLDSLPLEVPQPDH